MTYVKPRDLYDVIVTYISQSLHCMTSSTATGLPRMCTLDHITERRVHRCVCGQGDIEHHHHVVSPLLFVIALIPLTHILRTANLVYEFRSGETVNHLLFIEDLKLYSKNEMTLDSLVHTVGIFSEYIGMQFGIDKCVMLVMKTRKNSRVRRY